MTTTTSYAASDLHHGVAAIARALQLPADADPAQGLSFTIAGMPVCIEPTANGRIAAFFKLGDVALVSVPVMVSLLADAAAWGSDGETLRYAVVADDFVLLWTPAPMASAALVEHWREVAATALSARALATRFAD